MSNVTLTPPEVEEMGAGSPLSPNGQGGGRRGLASRLSFGHVLTAIAGVLTFIFLLVVLAERDNPEVTVVVAAERVDEGVPLTADLFEEINLPEDSPLVEGAVQKMDRLDGSRTAQRDIPARGVLTQSDFRDVVAETPGGGLRSLSIPIEVDKAVGGKIRETDLVDIIAVEKGQVWIPAAGLEVLDDGSGDGSSSILGGSSGNDYLTVAVTADEAVAVAFASSTADIFVLRSTGAERLPELSGVDGSGEVGVGGPTGDGSFVPADVNETINDALGGVLDELAPADG